MRKHLLVPILALSLTGCAARSKTITGSPPGVTQQQVQTWDRAVSNLDKIKTIVTNLRQTVIGLNQTTYTNSKGVQEKILPDGQAYITILESIGKVDQVQITAANFLQSVPNDWSLSTQQKIGAYAQQIATALGQLTQAGTVGIKNPSSQQQVLSLINEIAAIVGLYASLAQ